MIIWSLYSNSEVYQVMNLSCSLILSYPYMYVYPSCKVVECQISSICCSVKLIYIPQALVDLGLSR